MTGVNLDSDKNHNGEIKRAVNPNQWNAVRMDFEGGSFRVFLNEDQVYAGSAALPCHIVVKAQGAAVKVRTLIGLAYNP